MIDSSMKPFWALEQAMRVCAMGCDATEITTKAKAILDFVNSNAPAESAVPANTFVPVSQL